MTCDDGVDRARREKKGILMAENKNGPTVVGIDFGGDGLRAATDREGEPAVIALRCLSAPLRRVIRLQDGQEGNGAGYRILSLKRILDFDEVFRSQIKEVNVLEYVGQLFRNVREDKALADAGEVVRVVGAVPPCFSQRQRFALRTAITDAGFARTKLVDDSVAAILASRNQLQGKSSILVYSWGASTFCASLYRPSGASFRAIIAPEGDRQLGGDDIDAALLGYLERTLTRRWYVDFAKISGALFQEMERVKLELVEGRRGGVTLRGLGLVRKYGSDAEGEIEIPREVLDETVSSMQKRTFTLVDKVLAGGDCLNPDAVLVLGGTTQIPEVGRRLEERFPGRVVKAGLNAVVLGSVIHGRMLPAEEWEAAEKRQDASPRPRESVEVRSTPESQHPQAQGQLVKSQDASWSAMLDLNPLLDRAQESDRLGRLERAVESLEEIHRKLGRLSCFVYDKAASSHIDRGRADVGLALLRKANLFDPANPSIATRYAGLCMKLSSKCMEKKLYIDALQFAGEAVHAIEGVPDAEQKNPQNLATCLHQQARVLWAWGLLQDADVILRRCIALDPQQAAYSQDLSRIREATGNSSTGIRGRMSGSLRGRERNEPCPCGSGKKYKKCCGKK